MNLIANEKIQLAFWVSLSLKAIFAVSEIIGGFLAYILTLSQYLMVSFVSRDFLLNLVTSLTREELSEDPRDFIANNLLHLAQYSSVSSLRFTALYLVSHGVVKLWLIIGLFRKKLWYYPVAMVVFGLFILYQLYRYSFTHSYWLIFISVVDAIVIWFTWVEYGYLRAAAK
jgi:uncharacterized membrane protein